MKLVKYPLARQWGSRAHAAAGRLGGGYELQLRKNMVEARAGRENRYRIMERRTHFPERKPNFSFMNSALFTPTTAFRFYLCKRIMVHWRCQRRRQRGRGEAEEKSSPRGKALRSRGRSDRGRDFPKKYVVDEDLSKLEPAAATATAAWERRATTRNRDRCSRGHLEESTSASLK